MSLPFVAAISTWFAPAGAAAAGAAGAGAAAAAGAGVAAAGAATFSGSALGLIGSTLAGLGQGLMAKKERDSIDDARREEDQRRADSYSGAGEAVRFWEQEQGEAAEDGESGVEFQRADPNSNAALQVGQAEKPEIMGDKFRRKPAASERKFKYDRKTGAIVHE